MSGARHGQRRGRRLSPEERAQIIDAHRAGATTEELAAAHGLRQRSVARIVRRVADATARLAERAQPAHRTPDYRQKARSRWLELSTASLRPSSVTAAPFSRKWYLQNDRSFRTVMERAHPELSFEKRRGEGGGGCPQISPSDSMHRET